jgi:hypothetical protein
VLISHARTELAIDAVTPRGGIELSQPPPLLDGHGDAGLGIVTHAHRMGVAEKHNDHISDELADGAAMGLTGGLAPPI